MELDPTIGLARPDSEWLKWTSWPPPRSTWWSRCLGAARDATRRLAGRGPRRRDVGEASSAAPRRSPELIGGQLRRLGVPDELIDHLADGLATSCGHLEADAYARVLDGVSLTGRALHRARRTARDEQRELREVERLMGAFSGELEKLDEILEVLAAYARRMRTASAASNPQTLH